jgi:hypothetical protein
VAKRGAFRLKLSYDLRMVTRLGCMLACLTALVGLVPAHAAAPKIYALVAALGDQFTVVTGGQTTGSHLGPYQRRAVTGTNNVLNRLALSSLDKAIVGIDPESRRVYLVSSARFDAKAATEDAAIGSVLAELRDLPQRKEWDRIVLVTPAYQSLEHNDMASKLQGFGVFAQTVCVSDSGLGDDRISSCNYGFRPPSGPEALTPEGERIAANYFAAPYSYVEVWVIDAKTLSVLDRHQSFEHTKLWDPKSRSLDLPKEFLARSFINTVETAVRDAVLHTELRGTVELPEGRPVKTEGDSKSP